LFSIAPPGRPPGSTAFLEYRFRISFRREATKFPKFAPVGCGSTPGPSSLRSMRSTLFTSALTIGMPFQRGLSFFAFPLLDIFSRSPRDPRVWRTAANRALLPNPPPFFSVPSPFSTGLTIVSYAISSTFFNKKNPLFSAIAPFSFFGSKRLRNVPECACNGARWFSSRSPVLQVCSFSPLCFCSRFFYVAHWKSSSTLLFLFRGMTFGSTFQLSRFLVRPTQVASSFIRVARFSVFLEFRAFPFSISGLFFTTAHPLEIGRFFARC